ASYLIEGGGSKDFAVFRSFLQTQSEAAHALLDKLTETTIRYLRLQIDAGASAVQLFDSWAGLHDERAFRAFGLPYVQRILQALGDLGVPRLYLAVGASHLYAAIAELPCEAVSVDW